VISTKEGEEKAKINNLLYIETSAKTGENTKKVPFLMAIL